jgi:hypothetical protein
VTTAPDVIRSGARRRTYLSVARTVYWRHMHLVLRKPALLLPALVFPLFFYIAFAGGLSRVSDIPAFDYYDYNAFQSPSCCCGIGENSNAIGRAPDPIGVVPR